jgi:hypothetical protein
MKSETEHYQKVCTDAGVQFIEADGQFVFFQDVITKEKLSVEKAKFNNPSVQAIVTTARRKYPKDIEMLSDFTDAIRFLTNKYYVVPPRTIGDAALAATLVVQQFILTAEGKNNGSTQKAA